MRLDFAEERRWKIVLAREFAFQIVEWHLSSPEEKALLMVGERGWASRPRDTENLARRPAHEDQADVDMDGEDGTIGVQEETGAEVLDEMLPRRGTRGRGQARKRALDEDDDTVEAPNADTPDTAKPEKEVSLPEKSAAGNAGSEQRAEQVEGPKESATRPAEPDADGEADADGEIDDGEGSADIVDGVIGLEGETPWTTIAD